MTQTMVAAHAKKWWALALLAAVQFMVVLDIAIVNVALPSIQIDLGFSQGNLQWVISAYALVFGGFLLLGGRMADLLGRRRVFIAGLALFTLASLLLGFAWSETSLIALRALQGLGAAIISPAALSILTTTFAAGAERTKALGIWAAIATGGAAVGLLLGGVLTEFLSWPWIFFVNVPVGILAFIASLRFVPESRADAEHRIFDVPGAVTVTAGLVALVYGIVKVQEAGWTSWSTAGFGLAAVILLTAFVLIELRQKAPLVRLDVFRVRTLRAANISMLLVASGLFAMFFFNTLYVQRVLGFSPLEAGFAFLPVTMGIGLGAGLSQVFVKRIGIRATSIGGMSLATVGMLLLLTTSADGSYLGDVLPGLVPISIGMGLTFVPVTLLATSNVEHEDAGLASGLFNTSQQVGGALGLAILSTIAVDRTGDHLGGLPGQPSAVQQAEALVTGFHGAFFGGAVFFVLGITVMLLFLKRRDEEQVDVDRPVTELAA
ncbi:MAG TPA: MFS transporter [Gaiellaceae bacterium]|nr:MFS transporter [Gaiellaceae bacterium]